MPATAQQMKQLVQVAREAVADFKEDDADLRRIAFERILDHMLSGDAPDAAAASNGAAEDDWPPRTKVRRAGLIAMYFGIDAESAAELFDLSNRKPRLQLASNQVPKDVIRAIETIALLVAGARAAVGLETTVEDITEAAIAHRPMIPMDDRGLIPVPKVLQQMDEIAVLGEPGRANRIVRLKALGVEAAKERAAALAG